MTTNKWYFSQEQSVTGITKTELPDSEVVASSLATFTVPATGHHTQQPLTTGMIYFVICSNWHLISAPTLSKFVTHFTLQPDAKMLRHSHEKQPFIRGWVTSTRSWTGHLSQNTVQCLTGVLLQWVVACVAGGMGGM